MIDGFVAPVGSDANNMGTQMCQLNDDLKQNSDYAPI